MEIFYLQFKDIKLYNFIKKGTKAKIKRNKRGGRGQMSNLNLKGLWIPIEILTDTNLSDKEKHIYSLVIFLSQEKQYCFCTNKTISELLNISVTQVSKLVNSLKDKGYINIEMVYKENSKEIDIRKLIPIEEKLNTLFNKSLIPSPTKLQYPI